MVMMLQKNHIKWKVKIKFRKHNFSQIKTSVMNFVQFEV